jgi:CMP-N,N'-diacetyllegionaminic acid synthase
VNRTIPYLAVIPARGGSKRIPRKNLTLLGGKPLIAYTIEAAISSKRLSRSIVSTDDEEIASVAKQFGAEVPFLRPAELAQDKSAVLDAINHALTHLERQGDQIDTVVLLQPTSPLRTGKHVDEAIDLFESSGADTVTAVCNSREHPYYAWTVEDGRLQPFFSLEKVLTARQDLPSAVIENGSIFVINRSLIAENRIYGSIVVPYLMPPGNGVDIDTDDDLRWAQFLITQERE